MLDTVNTENPREAGTIAYIQEERLVDTFFFLDRLSCGLGRL